MIKNIIFDWSGTLADDLGPVLTATNAIFRKFGRKELTREEFRLQFRLPYAEFYSELLPEATIEGLEELYIEFFANLHDDVTLLPGAKDLLDWCRANGRRTFLLSTIKTDHFVVQAGKLGVFDAFEIAYTGIQDKREKIRALLKDHDLCPSETVFIGDMVHDIETARYGGITSVAVLTGFDPLEKLLPSSPDVIVKDLPVFHRMLG